MKIVRIHETLMTFQTIKYNLKILDKAMKNISRAAIKLIFQLSTLALLHGWKKYYALIVNFILIWHQIFQIIKSSKVDCPQVKN